MEAASSIASRILSGVTVVVVEYHDHMRALVAEFLTQHGATVIACASASEGLEAMKQNRADVVLSELNLPREDGFQLLQSIRGLGLRAISNTPAIAMNSLGCSILRKRALSEGFDGYLDKPFTPKDLLETIQSALRLTD
jgi:DNA-binding response OmpR family regulator